MGSAVGDGRRALAEEVPVGYKRTEVGVIPEEWRVSAIGTEFRVQLGKMLDAAKNSGVPRPYIGNRSVQWGRIDVGDIDTVPMTLADLQRFRLRRGDLLVCEGGEIGRAAIWDNPIPECYYQKALHRLRPIRSYDIYLMMSLLQLWASTGYLANYVTQTSIAHLPKDKLEIVPLPVPPPDEQRAIAEALSDVDGLLAALEALIAKKRAIKQAAMQQLLTGKSRLPGFSGEWREEAIGLLANVVRGASPRPIDSPVWFDSQSKIGWLRISDVTASGKFLYDTIQNLSAAGIANSRFVKSGNLVMSICATVGRPIIMRKDVCIHDGFVVFDNLRADKEYLYYFLSNMEESWSKHGQTGSQMNLNTDLINSTSVLLPPLAEQRAIAAVLSDMDAEIAALERRRDKTRVVKQGMMQQLLTGQVRLVESKQSWR